MTPLLTRGGRPQDYEVENDILSWLVILGDIMVDDSQWYHGWWLSVNLIIIVKITINQTNGNDDYGDNQPLNEDDEVDFRTVQSPKKKFLWSIQIQAIIVITKEKKD